MDLDDTLGDELAGLEVMRHLALGSAHTLNNALTAILGEVQLLAEDCGDRDVGAACTSIRREVERCARLTRALCECGARRGREPALDPQVDLAALARRLAPLLRDTVSRGVDIDWQLPDDAGPVYGDRTDVERLVLLSAYRLVRGAPSGAALRIALDASTQPPELAFELRAPAGQRTTSSVWDRVVAQTAQRLADRNQIGIESREMGDAIRLRFAAAGDEAAD